MLDNAAIVKCSAQLSSTVHIAARTTKQQQQLFHASVVHRDCSSVTLLSLLEHAAVLGNSHIQGGISACQLVNRVGESQAAARCQQQ